MAIIKSTKIAAAAALALLLAPMSAVAMAATAEDKPENVDVYSHVYANSDGTYSLYIDSNSNVGKVDFLTGDYTIPATNERYPVATITALPKYATNIKAEIVSPQNNPETKVSIAGDTISWTMDLGMTPEPPTGFPPIPKQPRNTLKITFALAEGYSGSILPFPSIQYPLTSTGANGPETGTMRVWQNAITVEEPSNLTLSSAFYPANQSDATTPEAITELQRLCNNGTPEAWVNYTITNPNKVTAKHVMFEQNLTLTDVVSDQNPELTSLAAGTPVELKDIPAGTSVHLWAKVSGTDLNKKIADAKGKVTFTYKHVESGLDKENTLGSGEYVALMDASQMGDPNVQPPYIARPAYGWSPNYTGPVKTTFFYDGANVETDRSLTAEASTELQLLENKTPCPTIPQDTAETPQVTAETPEITAETPKTGAGLAKTGLNASGALLATLTLLVAGSAALVWNRKRS
ncbi:hypothetical protein [Boudabousia marimammalium]|uniref:Gram-positive cocci surface proteins LPxTG domain-containing protein n=1 Tax=Boudabousia marimammalium TaxID=156892 RepID=A0A1Q5PSA3_9ACTO|nr:hypothetical protein [Boudabousia marimammalium]OKL50413.1 hypothetical protein BM477_00070 [Boudabousia marimammalium]